MRLRGGLAKELLGRGRISPRSQKEIDRLPSAVHRPREIRPASLHPNVGFVHPPGAVANAAVRFSSSAAEAWIHRRYHRTAQRIASAVNCGPLKQLPRPILTPARSFPLNPTGSPPAAKFATEPSHGWLLPSDGCSNATGPARAAHRFERNASAAGARARCEARGAYAAKCSAVLMSTCGSTSDLHLAIGTAAAAPTP